MWIILRPLKSLFQNKVKENIIESMSGQNPYTTPPRTPPIGPLTTTVEKSPPNIKLCYKNAKVRRSLTQTAEMRTAEDLLSMNRYFNAFTLYKKGFDAELAREELNFDDEQLIALGFADDELSKLGITEEEIIAFRTAAVAFQSI